MPLNLYNTASRGKELFQPIKEGKANIYVCGVTVYDLCHIGHARSTIVFDVLARYLRATGLEVTYVRNFTDIDDKIIKRANESGQTTSELARKFIDAFYEDMDCLHVLRADAEPLATDHVEGMIQMINTLLERGYAYSEGADVYFSVTSFKGYGQLSGRKIEDMQAGSRIAVDTRKRYPMDFVLWKGAKPGEPQWDSPWGQGRPGWHLERSVMSHYFLGSSFDIHGGGKDLLFPHHENERAQSLCANQGSFAKYWVHNGFVTVEGEKMSKSLGNFLTIRDALSLYHPEVLRLFLLSKHYRSPLDFSKKEVLAQQTGLVRIYRLLQRLEELLGPDRKEQSKEPEAFLDGDFQDSFLAEFIKIMDDDLNTAGAIGLIFEKVRTLNKCLDAMPEDLEQTTLDQLLAERRQLLLAGRVLGLFQGMPADFFKKVSGQQEETISSTEIEALVAKRAEAKAKKDWAGADEIRDRLKSMGIILEDGPQGTSWRVDV